MKAWWAALDNRERRVLVVGGLVLAAILLYFFAWEPYVTYARDLRQSVADKRTQLSWMAQRSEEVIRLRASATREAPVREGSLMGQVDASARAAAISSFIKRIEPQGSASVRVWLERAKFDDVVLWLGQLENESRIRIDDLRLELGDRSGYINGRITLTGAGS